MEELIDDYTYVPKDVQEDVRAACCNLLPRKSKQLYHKELEHFEQWKKKRQVIGVSEEIVLTYFRNYKNSLAPSSMWTKYSMLKSTLKVYKNIDISKYGKLISYLKMESRAHKPKKSKVLERNHMEKFLNEAPDSQYLMMKVVVIMGISGACRCDELTNLTVDFIEDNGGYLFVSIPETKTNISKSFTIVEEGFSTNVFDIYRKYASLRPKNVPHSRFFLNYKNEKCTTQAVGINSISKIPSFLKLPEAQLYTGHSLRRSSATLLANADANLTTLKQHGAQCVKFII